MAAVSRASEFVVQTTEEGVTEVLALTSDGAVDRVFTVSKHQDGWWPDSYQLC